MAILTGKAHSHRLAEVITLVSGGMASAMGKEPPSLPMAKSMSVSGGVTSATGKAPLDLPVVIPMLANGRIISATGKALCIDQMVL